MTEPTKESVADEVMRLLRSLMPLTNARQQPNINDLWMLLKDIEVLRLNVKNFGYQLGRQLAQGFEQIDVSGQPRPVGLVSKPTTQADVESPWFVHWCGQLKTAPIYHRKLWEYAFALQALYEADLLRAGTAGIGFGCGREPLASYFASRGMPVTVTDADPGKIQGAGWVETGQHTSSRDQAFYPDIVAREDFDRLVEHAFVDMNAIPPGLDGKYDFCWSICALEHLGSIEQGLRFVENSLLTLKPGGIAVHTTEFNYLSDTKTIDNWPTVLFLQSHFRELSERLARGGHRMLGPDFDTGGGALDRFIDVPPYHSAHEVWLNKRYRRDGRQHGHLKLAIDGFPCTCFGLIIQKFR